MKVKSESKLLKSESELLKAKKSHAVKDNGGELVNRQILISVLLSTFLRVFNSFCNLSNRMDRINSYLVYLIAYTVNFTPCNKPLCYYVYYYNYY